MCFENELSKMASIANDQLQLWFINTYSHSNKKEYAYCVNKKYYNMRAKRFIRKCLSRLWSVPGADH